VNWLVICSVRLFTRCSQERTRCLPLFATNPSCTHAPRFFLASHHALLPFTLRYGLLQTADGAFSAGGVGTGISCGHVSGRTFGVVGDKRIMRVAASCIRRCWQRRAFRAFYCCCNIAVVVEEQTADRVVLTFYNSHALWVPSLVSWW